MTGTGAGGYSDLMVTGGVLVAGLMAEVSRLVYVRGGVGAA